jgi:hypothetical protein
MKTIGNKNRGRKKMKKVKIIIGLVSTIVATSFISASAASPKLEPLQPQVDLHLNYEAAENAGKQANVAVPNTFSAHTQAKADEVNENFNALKNKINAKKPAGVDWAIIEKTQIDVRSDSVIVGSVEITAPATGYVVVRFDGVAIPSAGDRLLLAASDDNTWHVNSGNSAVYGDGRRHPFSHTRVYKVTKGTHVFNAIAHNYVKTGGNGKASIYATLTATYYYTRY